MLRNLHHIPVQQVYDQVLNLVHLSMIDFFLDEPARADELGIQPMGATRSLYKKILHQQERPRTWRGALESNPPDKGETQDGLQSLAENALHKLHRLQSLLDETGAELNQIERLISRALGNSRH